MTIHSLPNHRVKSIKITPHSKGNLKALVRVIVSIHDVDVQLHGCRVVQEKGKKPYAHLPTSDRSYPFCPKHCPLIRFPKDIEKEIKEAILDRWSEESGGGQ